MSEYRVIITETLKRAVTVEAESREEAEEAVRRQYQNSEHILVAEDFDGVSFSAQYPEQQVELPYGKMKELFRKAERAGTHVCGYITFMHCAQRQSGTVPNRPTHIGRRSGSCPKGSKRCAGKCICATILPSAPA